MIKFSIFSTPFNSSHKLILIPIFFLLLFQQEPSADNLELTLLKEIHQQRNKNLDNTFLFITNSSTYLSLGIPIFTFTTGIIKKDSALIKNGIYLGETILVSIITSTCLKYITQRNRPFVSYPDIIENIANESGYSFPSRHTSNAFATATSLSIVFPKWYVILPSFLWASSIAYSRLHLGAHYPTDVFAGALLGCASGYITYKLNKLLKAPFPFSNF
ncbi:MAG: phosphatase PAP2 family protein [Chitinispirillaceae bacterium]|nr:phosphatase PAP2 family protein [Chitinispirillaceae bacterium]